MRTVTTNKTNADVDLMEQDIKDMLANQVSAHTQQMIKSIMDDGLNGERPYKLPAQVYHLVARYTTQKRTVSYPDGYWAKIEINETDHVTYKVFNSGWLAKMFNSVGFRKVLVNGWDSVKQRDTVEATLGATYMAIDESIAADLKSAKHSKFLKEMIKTDPENLKAIAQLDMLDKGDGPGTDTAVEPVLSASGVSGMNKYSQNISVSGSGTYAKMDLSKPAALSIGPISVGGGSEDIISMDPDGEVSFGPEMAKAIKAAVDTTEKGEVHE